MSRKKKRLLIIIISAVLVLAIGGGGTAWYFLSDNGAVVTESKKKKKTKKKTKKKKNSNSSQTEDGIIDGDDGYIFDPDDWDPDDVVDNDSGSNTDESKESSPYEFELDYVKPLDMNERIAFQAYHYKMDGWDDLTGESQYNVFNYYYCSNITELKKIRDAGCMAWIGIGNPFSDRETLEISEIWKENKKQLVDACKSAGLWDAVAGFHGEELMLGMSGEQFRTVTKYLSDTYPGKRIYCVLSLYEIDGSAPTVKVDPMTYRTYGYVTDIGYDWYDSNDYDQHMVYVKKMMDGIGRKNVRIWLFPTTYRRFDERDAAYCCASLDMCYKMLMDLKNAGYVPGGLDCYTWGTFGSEDGLGRLLDKEVWGDDYDLLRDKLREIGGQILADSYRYKEAIN